MTNLDSILKSRDITLPIKVCLVKAMVFPVVIYRCESCTIKKAECRKIDAFELWYSCLENPMDRGVWWATVQITKSRTRLKQLSSSRLVITFLPRSKHLFISWLQSPSAVILEPPKIASHCFPSYLPGIDGTGCFDLSFLNIEF